VSHWTPLTSPESWEGVWVRVVAGPNTSGRTVHTHPWHQIERVDEDGLHPVHRASVVWPFMGSRLEVYRPSPGFRSLPPEGRICSRCVAIKYPLHDSRPAERQKLVDEEEDQELIDKIAARVVELLERKA
jgi:hypothetical protein